MIEQFDRCMLERFLRDQGLRFLTDQDGDFFLDFYGEEDAPDYEVTLCVQGDSANVLVIRISPRVVYPEPLRDRIEGFVAGWNRRTFWPKAYLAEHERGRGIKVIGESAFPLGPGIHQDLLECFLGSTMAAGYDMLIELAQVVAGSSDQPESWVSETS